MSEGPGLETRVVDLECRLAFLEETLEQLSAVVATQDSTLARIDQRLEKLVASLRSGRDGEDADPLSEPPPPHY